MILGVGALLVAGLGFQALLGARGHPTPASAAAQIQDADGGTLTGERAAGGFADS